MEMRLHREYSQGVQQVAKEGCAVFLLGDFQDMTG